jgi:uncharacterized protein (UPF0332 family)
MSPDDFWAHALYISENLPGAASYRSAVSRAYYAAFHKTRDFLTEAGLLFPRTIDPAALHRYLPLIYDGTGDAEVDMLGPVLGALRDERNRADYDLDDPGAETKAFADSRVGDAGDLIVCINGWRRTEGVSGGRYEQVIAVLIPRARFVLGC